MNLYTERFYYCNISVANQELLRCQKTSTSVLLRIQSMYFLQNTMKGWILTTALYKIFPMLPPIPPHSSKAFKFFLNRVGDHQEWGGMKYGWEETRIRKKKEAICSNGPLIPRRVFSGDAGDLQKLISMCFS